MNKIAAAPHFELDGCGCFHKISLLRSCLNSGEITLDSALSPAALLLAGPALTPLL
jgi:hypothetical protein